MSENHVASASARIDAPASRVWSVITDLSTMGALLGDSTIETDWKVGSEITWSGEYEGKPFVDRGEIVAVERSSRLVYTHKPASSDAVHTLTWTLRGDQPTDLVLTQDNNSTAEEAANSKRMWDQLVAGIKQAAES